MGGLGRKPRWRARRTGTLTTVRGLVTITTEAVPTVTITTVGWPNGSTMLRISVNTNPTLGAEVNVWQLYPGGGGRHRRAMDVMRSPRAHLTSDMVGYHGRGLGTFVRHAGPCVVAR